MSIKLIALDLDGTLTNDEKKVTEHTKEVLLAAGKKGVSIALASGRPMLGVSPIAEFLELNSVNSFVMAFNGGQIVNYRTGEVINYVNFNHDYIPEAVSCARRYGMPILTYSDTEIFTEGPLDQWANKEVKNCNKSATLVADLVKTIEFPIVKMMICGDPEKLAVTEKEIAASFEGRLDIYRAEPWFLEMMPKGINKFAGVKMIADSMGLQPEEVMACGDANNDIPMLEYAGLGVAVANASDQVKAIANFISTSNNEDGVAVAVEKFVL
ncbi:MAG: Cof-type HAD-IIB family hydrolase [Eubacteriales bacterium]|nr:Cof-type HAD-IIB family hydrolase [Eubacteriales bacterium]